MLYKIYLLANKCPRDLDVTTTGPCAQVMASYTKTETKGRRMGNSTTSLVKTCFPYTFCI
jgi:hypothetical protein